MESVSFHWARSGNEGSWHLAPEEGRAVTGTNIKDPYTGDIYITHGSDISGILVDEMSAIRVFKQ